MTVVRPDGPSLVPDLSAELNNPDCRWPDAAGDLIRNAPWRRVCVLGDSVAEGVREPVPGYRDLDGIGRVIEALRAAHPDLEYLNLGERNLRAAQIRETQLRRALAAKPELAIVAAGANDAFGRGFDPDRVEAELDSLLAPLAEQGAQLVTMGLFDIGRTGLLPEQLSERLTQNFGLLDQITERAVTRYGGTHTANRHHPMAASREVMCSDFIHINAHGHAISGVNLVKALLRLP
ncbi:MAG: SGNH/GDSL hydrolase family protein [Kibdelosporangium sp.]